jgi:hypothetical protein
MNARDKEELLESLEEMKELVDAAFPLESSVVRDQVLSMLAAMTIQGAMMRKLTSTPAEMQFDFRHVLDWLKLRFDEYRVIMRENMAAQLTKVAADKGKEWAWEAYQEFIVRQERGQ